MKIRKDDDSDCGLDSGELEALSDVIRETIGELGAVEIKHDDGTQSDMQKKAWIMNQGWNL